MSKQYDIIVIGAGSGGLGISIFMAKVGLKTLLIEKSDERIGGDCLNDGCVPSKALIHIAKIAKHAQEAEAYGYTVTGKPDIAKAMQYVKERQDVIRKHENAAVLRKEGMDVELGTAHFVSKNEISVNGTIYSARKIVLATGSRPSPLTMPGAELVEQYNNESVFHLENLPKRIMVIGGGPIGIEIGQALSRLGAEVTIVHRRSEILPHDAPEVAVILREQLTKEGVKFVLNAEVSAFTGKNEAVIKLKDDSTFVQQFDAVFVGVGRHFDLTTLKLENAGIEHDGKKLIVSSYLETTNKDVFAVGDIAGSLQFSHAAEQHVRMLLNNLFSPLKKKLNNDHMSWVTFTDPEVATFGISEADLTKRGKYFEKMVMDFGADDRAVVDNYRYGKLVLYVTKGGMLKKQKILGGSMVAPSAGELIQELILANTSSLSTDAIFNKIYPYPVASRVNQLILVKDREKLLSGNINKMLQFFYRLFN